MRLPAAIIVAVLATPAIAAEKSVVIPEGQTGTGRCIGVHDGDSMTLLVDTPQGKRRSKIHLDAIDAPELGQPFSNRSKQTLSGMVFEKECHVESLGPGEYGPHDRARRDRREGRERRDAQSGHRMAWHFEKYDARQSMADLHDAARKARVGLWGDAGPIPHWEWRKMSKEERALHREKAGAR